MSEYTNRSTLADSLTLEDLQESLDVHVQWFASQRWRELNDPMRVQAKLWAAKLDFEGLGIPGNHITVAPDVFARLRQLPELGGEMEDGTLILHGLPVYVAPLLPKGYWMRWENGVPVEVGKLKAE